MSHKSRKARVDSRILLWRWIALLPAALAVATLLALIIRHEVYEDMKFRGEVEIKTKKQGQRFDGGLL